MLFGKRQKSVAARNPVSASTPAQPDMFIVEYDRMLKGNKLSRRGRPIRQVAVVVHGTVTLITSGDMVDRKTYEALIAAGALAADGASMPNELPKVDDTAPDEVESA